MRTSIPGRHHLRRLACAAVTVALTLSALAVASVVGSSDRAAAAVPPIVDTTPAQVTTDALPTVQVNGVVWDTEIVGNTVYAVGEFTQARPAGAAPGTNETPRNNMLAFDLSTGQLIQSFAPSFNAQVKSVVASPDGSRLYVAGNFTSVNGSARYYVAAINPTTGALITSFTAGLNYRANDVVATNSTVYVGGAFASVGGNTRTRLAAFQASNGALLSWAPSADAEVHTMVLSPDGTRVFAGGKFKNINGSYAYGMGAIDAASGALIPWAANTVIMNGGTGGAILDLRTDGVAIYGSGYTYGSTMGNLEGSFKADPTSGAIEWVEDCHGDTYQIAPANGFVYIAGHPHISANVGGFPQSDSVNSQWAHNRRNTLAFRDVAAGTLRRENWSYDNHEGKPAPSVTAWYPVFNTGTYTGMGQSTWAVEGSSQYVVYGGEFTGAGGAPNQQGLVRFAVESIAPCDSGPKLSGSEFPIKVVSPAAGQVRVSFPANWDRDDGVLSYRITRNGATVHTTSAMSAHWDQPTINFLDTGLTPGQSYSYRVTATDDDGNSAQSNLVPVTVALLGAPRPYADTVMTDGPRIYWRLGEAQGATSAADTAAFQTGAVNAMTFGRPGAIIGDTDTAASPTGTSSRVTQPPFVRFDGKSERHPTVDELSVEAWFRTTSTSGGRLLGFGGSNTDSSGTSNNDRVLYVTNDGRAMFGVRTAPEHTGKTSSRERRTVESAPGLNNGAWHHVVGTLSSEGLQLYVDGVRVAARDDTNSGHGYYGYWRVGADTLSSWPRVPSSSALAGDIDEAAVYYRALSAPRVAAHYSASGRVPSLTPPPSDSYGAAVHALDPYLYYRLAEPSGTTANDSGIRVHTGDYAGSSARGQSGIVGGNAAVGFSGAGSVSNRDRLDSPGAFSLETWFNTTTNSGGALMGFGSSRTGLSATTDRQVYLRDDGRLAFRVGGSHATEVVGSSAVNDGQWHHVVATQGLGGTDLYLDGNLVGSAPNEVAASYRGWWRIGGDSAPASATADYFSGRLDEAAVYDKALTAAQVLQHLQLGGGEVGNTPPSAAFSTSADDLALSFDGSASDDPDGSIVSYAWDFGDGESASGASPTTSHTYAASGQYTVTLTVTDDEGAIGQVSHTYDLTANAPPTASFSTGVNGLSVNVDGSGSGDSDGTVDLYSWSFGDGDTATGQTAGHTYATGGTYTITLTVTDDEGATGSTAQQVTVTAPGGPVTYAADAFERSVATGMGSADTGGAWTLQGSAANYSVAGGDGRHHLGRAGWILSSYLNSVSARDVVGTVDVALDKAPTGGGTYLSLAVRRIGTSEYRLRARANPTSTTLTLSRFVNGTETTLSAISVPGLVYNVGDVLRIKLQAVGNGTTALGGKLWKVGSAEPTNWQVTANDTTAELQAPGGVGLISYLSGSSTNAPVVALYDDLLVTSL